jgi:hypothetical protein
VNIVILHCHFERGGVTQVVENHVRWLRDCQLVDRIILISGQRASGLSSDTLESVTHVAANDFDYDTQEPSADSSARRAGRIAQHLAEQLRGFGVTQDNSVLHWHNHSLGKNTAAPATIRQMAQSGWRLLLQIHDFAEDNRPQNYQPLIAASGAANKVEIDRYLYPTASQIHYATLTRADASVLTRLGIPAGQTHCLPNSVLAPAGEQSGKDASLAKVRRAMRLPSDARWCLYPVRGIRRKNVGEFLMLARWIRPDQFAGLTLEPATPIEKRSYRRWKQLAKEVAPRAVFDASHDRSVSFAESVSASDFIVSTSVAEGFGMAFLEPWLMHREVIARRLPTVTDDFEACGVKLPKFYDKMPIPGTEAWVRDCLAESTSAMTVAWSDLPEHFRPSLDVGTSVSADSIDFALLTPQRQMDVLRKVAQDSGFEAATKERSSQLITSLGEQPDEQLLQDNADVVNRQYSPQQTGRRLIAIYQELVGVASDSVVAPPCHAGKGIDLINDARPFFPCRTEVFDV